MPKFILIFVFLLAPNAFAEECLEITEQQMNAWKAVRPDMPGFTDLLKAKKIIDAEKSYSLKLGNDKRAHCYLGCRISEDVNFETADFVAWQKEYNDATDCNQNTHFEIADYDATIKGARRGSSKKLVKIRTKKLCTDYCKKVY